MYGLFLDVPFVYAVHNCSFVVTFELFECGEAGDIIFCGIKTLSLSLQWFF